LDKVAAPLPVVKLVGHILILTA